jgi:hypothetical protein
MTYSLSLSAHKTGAETDADKVREALDALVVTLRNLGHQPHLSGSLPDGSQYQMPPA